MIESLNYTEISKCVFFDFETCNTNLIWPENKVWQVGFAVCEEEVIVKKAVAYLKWEPLNISPGAAAVTHFNRQVYEANWRDPAEVLNEFEPYFYNPEYRIIGHNILGFDVYLHQILRRLLGKPTDWSYIPRCIDTHALAKGIKEGIKYRPGEDIMAYQYRMLSIVKKGLKTSLTTLGKENNIDFDYDSLHDGLQDVILNKLIWDKYIRFNINI